MNITQAVYHSQCPGCGKPSGEVRAYSIPTTLRGMAGKGHDNAWQKIPAGWVARARVPRATKEPTLEVVCSWECAATVQEREEAAEGTRIIDPRAFGKGLV